MKKLLNTLFVTTEGAYLARDGESLLVRIEQQTRLRLPIHTLSGIVCFGRVSASPALMALAAEHDIAISFLSQHGRFLARVQGPVSGNVLLRRKQFRSADDDSCCSGIASAIVSAKIANSRTVLLRTARDYPDLPSAPILQQTAASLARQLQQLQRPHPLETIRGIEGDAARDYFNAFDHLILAQKEHFHFHERSRRPPLDNVNSLLSFFYTLLAHDVASALESVGLDPQVGFLHKDRPGRPGLALDLMEEFRPFLADRLALSLINRKQVQPNGFNKTETGAIFMTDDSNCSITSGRGSFVLASMSH